MKQLILLLTRCQPRWYHWPAGLLALGPWLIGCVEPDSPRFKTNVNVVVVDGTITDLPERQVVRLNRSRADPYTGRFGDIPLAGAQVSVVVNGTEEVIGIETSPGSYQLPAGFRGRVGDRYQLHFQLADGTPYESSVETMPAVPGIEKVTHQYNPDGIAAGQVGDLTAAHDLFLTTQDPAGEANYYRWDWVLWERQDWCHTCPKDLIYYERDASNQLVEGCRDIGNVPISYPRPLFIDYECRTKCWEILFNSELNLFSDIYTNGGTIQGRRVAQIPFHQYAPCLVEIRQVGLTPQAYQFYRRLAEQSQRNGGLADTPPSAPVGNVRNLNDGREPVVGYFSASAVSVVRYWLDRKNVTGPAPRLAGESPNLFQALNGRQPVPEPIRGYRGRPPLAVCVPSDRRTPVAPEGWRE